MLSFFVQENVLQEIKEIMRIYNFSVRDKGFAYPDDVAFFYNSEKKGFCFNAHKFEEKDIPDCVYPSPFLVCVGVDWTTEGLLYVIKQYRKFFFRKIPVLSPEMSDEDIIEICKQCVTLPWGSFPKTEEGQKKLAIWFRKVNKVFFPLNFRQSSASNKLTTLW
jgi:hypothetical protein